jgi:hypothetical protein
VARLCLFDDPALQLGSDLLSLCRTHDPFVSESRDGETRKSHGDYHLTLRHLTLWVRSQFRTAALTEKKTSIEIVL